jgi:hypothetical protein
VLGRELPTVEVLRIRGPSANRAPLRLENRAVVRASFETELAGASTITAGPASLIRNVLVALTGD